MQIVESPEQARFVGKRFIAAEFMYRPRPTIPREQLVFDAALSSRLAALDERDAVLYVADSQATIDSLNDFQAQFPHVLMLAIITKPHPLTPSPFTERGNQTQDYGWPGQWQRFDKTDRWCRIEVALRVGGALSSPGYLIMAAHDACWGGSLLPRLVDLSQHYSRNGLPAAVSPYTYYQHSSVPGANIPQPIIDLLNTAFGRDSLFGWKIRTDRVQAFWGKMGMIPFGMCRAILEQVDQTVWEDDLEIDRVIRLLGYGVRCAWIRDPMVYRQVLPVFDRDGVRRVIERTLHYSLNIPSATVGESSLNFPLGTLGKLRRLINPKFRMYNAQAEALIAECNAEISARLKQFGVSWVDWGAYRYVMRVGDPVVEVWRQVEPLA